MRALLSSFAMQTHPDAIHCQLSTDTSNGSSTTVDPKGYLTDLNSMIVQSDAQIGCCPL